MSDCEHFRTRDWTPARRLTDGRWERDAYCGQCGQWISVQYPATPESPAAFNSVMPDWDGDRGRPTFLARGGRE